MHNRHRNFVGVPCRKRDGPSQRTLIDAILTDQTYEKVVGGWEPGWLGRSVEELAALAAAEDGPDPSQEQIHQNHNQRTEREYEQDKIHR
jgi:hypothetical protein